MLRELRARIPTFWRIALGGLTGAVLAIGVGATLLPRTYAASSSIIFPVRSGMSALEDLSLTALGNMAQPSGAEFPLATFEAVLNSDRAALNVARDVGARELWGLHDEEELRRFMTTALSSKVNNIDRSMSISAKVRGTPMVRSLGDLFSRADADQRDLAFREAAKAMVEALTREMDAISNDMALDRTRARLDGVAKQLRQEQAKFVRLRDRLAELQQRHAAPDVTSKATLLGTQAAEWRSQLDFLDAQLASKKSALDKLSQQLAWQLAHVEDLPAEDPLLQGARAGFQAARQKHQEASKVHGPESPEVLRARSDLQLAEARLREEATAARGQGTPEMQALRVAIAGLERERAELSRGLRERNAEIRALPFAAAELTMAVAEVEQQSKVIATLRASQTSAEMDYLANGVRWSVLDGPRVPQRKASPRLSVLGLAGFLLGSVLFAAAAWRELLARFAAALTAADQRPASDAPA